MHPSIQKVLWLTGPKDACFVSNAGEHAVAEYAVSPTNSLVPDEWTSWEGVPPFLLITLV